MGVSTDLGFQVSSRKGVQIKVSHGDNDLTAMLACYRQHKSVGPSQAPQVLSHTPSCVAVPEATVLRGSWTANHYSAARFVAVASAGANTGLDLVPLTSLVEFCSDGRRPEAWRKGWAFISVLHILGEGFVDIGGALSYAPKTPGVPTAPGELLLSRINPRIPRVCVVPDLGIKTLCSSEFEVMRTIGLHLDVYAVAYLLQTEVVQSQIRSLTSGTSASHNRIRTSDLAEVMVPVPQAGTRKALAFDAVVRQYTSALQFLSTSAATLAAIRSKDVELFSRTRGPAGR